MIATRDQASSALIAALRRRASRGCLRQQRRQRRPTGSIRATPSNLIKPNPANNGVQLTVGSKNFTEQYILGEIYAQALEAAGYDVNTHLNLGSETIALKALQDGEISGYPEYTSTALDVVLRQAARTCRPTPSGRTSRPSRTSRSRARRPSRRPRSRTRTRSGC